VKNSFWGLPYRLSNAQQGPRKRGFGTQNAVLMLCPVKHSGPIRILQAARQTTALCMPYGPGLTAPVSSPTSRTVRPSCEKSLKQGPRCTVSRLRTLLLMKVIVEMRRSSSTELGTITSAISATAKNSLICCTRYRVFDRPRLREGRRCRTSGFPAQGLSPSWAASPLLLPKDSCMCALLLAWGGAVVPGAGSRVKRAQRREEWPKHGAQRAPFSILD
jgi:hypothetical protein